MSPALRNIREAHRPGDIFKDECLSFIISFSWTYLSSLGHLIFTFHLLGYPFKDISYLWFGPLSVKDGNVLERITWGI